MDLTWVQKRFPTHRAGRHTSPCLTGNGVCLWDILPEVGSLDQGSVICHSTCSQKKSFLSCSGVLPLVTSWHLPFCPWPAWCACRLVWRSRARTLEASSLWVGILVPPPVGRMAAGKERAGSGPPFSPLLNGFISVPAFGRSRGLRNTPKARR